MLCLFLSSCLTRFSIYSWILLYVNMHSYSLWIGFRCKCFKTNFEVLCVVWLFFFFFFFNLISCGRIPGWFCLDLDLCWDRFNDGVGVYVAEEEGGCRIDPPINESLHTANFDSSFKNFYSFSCIYWLIHLQKLSSVTLIIYMLYLLYYFISMEKGCRSDFHLLLWHKQQLNVSLFLTEVFFQLSLTFKITRCNKIKCMSFTWKEILKMHLSIQPWVRWKENISF